MLLCDHCGGESTVVLTRQVKNEMLTSARKKKTVLSVVRTRQCQTCRWKWRTIERLYTPTEHRGTKTALAKRAAHNRKWRKKHHELHGKHSHSADQV